MHVPTDLQDGVGSCWLIYIIFLGFTSYEWSGWRDLNARLLRPERSALPDWATSRHDVNDI